jgi:hypothetical protein
MRLDGGEAVRSREIQVASGSQDTDDLADMVRLSLEVAHVLDDVVRDDEVEGLVGKRQRRSGDDAETDRVTIETLVDNVDGPDVTARPDTLLERLCYDPGSGSDLEHARSIEHDVAA